MESSWKLDPTVQGLMVTKTHSHGVGSNEVILTSTMKCQGSNTCYFPWYVPFAAYFKISVPAGLSNDDYVAVNYNSVMTYNRSSYWGWFMPRVGKMSGKCHFCASDCTYNFWSKEYSLNVTTPTILDTLWVCLGDTQKSVFLKKQIWFLPRPTQELALDGELTFGIGLYSASGNVKADAIYKMTVLESDWVTQTTTTTTATTTTSTTGTTTGAAALARSAEGESHTQTVEEDMKPSMSMVDVMQEVFSGMAAEGSRASAASMSKSSSRWLSPDREMIFNLSIKSIAAGNSLSYEFDSGCSNPGGDYTALSCRIPLDAATGTLASMSKISFDAQPGSKLSFAYQTRSSDKIMKKLPMYFQKLSIDAPLCGSARYTRAKVSLWDGSPGLPSGLYKTPECGYYSFSFSTGGPKPIDFLSFLDMMTPMAMEPSDDLLPWSKTVWLKLTDHSGATIIDLEF